MKNFFVQGDRAFGAREYMDPSKPAALPLHFMGEPIDLAVRDGEVCEMWLGPCGDQILHFHPKSESRFRAYAGGDPILARNYPGEVYLFLTTEAPYWVTVCLLSLRSQFKAARRFAGNLSLADAKAQAFYFDEPNKEEQGRLHAIKAYLRSDKREKANRFAVEQGFEERFLAKLALGLGYNLLGEKFVHSQHAQVLRGALAEKDFERRQSLGFAHSGFFPKDPVLERILTWEGGHCLAIVPTGGILALLVSIFGRPPMTAFISDDPSLWGERFNGKCGEVYIAVPQRDMWVGPIEMPQFIAHKTGTQRYPELAALEALRVVPGPLPSCR
ncbi:MAG: hypothetical protein WBS54_15785 [Acidobacteriota bacterium]